MKQKRLNKISNELKKVLLAAFVCVVILSSRSSAETNEDSAAQSEQKWQTEETTDISDDEETTDDCVSDSEGTESSTEDSFVEPSAVPEYSGSPYVDINGGIPYFSETDKERTDAFETYSSLDSLGRCGVAYANICAEIMPTEERDSIGQIKPSGWHTVRYDELIEDKYLYNRCHLIAYELAGENANEKNLITGTRYMNVTGMLPFENKVAEYVQSTGNHVLYRSTPVFDGDNLVASGVEIEAYSVEDQGEGICFNVYCYNVQPGIIIDYANGDSEISDTADSEIQENEAESAANNSDVNNCDYVVNTNTGKFHYPTCSSVRDMKQKNAIYYSGERQNLIDDGYEPCKMCNP